MGSQQPYMYSGDFNENRYSQSNFDPKAVTRASWEPKPKKPKQDGPLVSFNRHPDAHEVPRSRRTAFKPMSSGTKNWMIRMRVVQLGARILELIAALGLLVLMILFTNVDPLTAWVMRITPGVVALHCVYSIYHHARSPRGRTPASSAAYQLFSAFTDLAILPLYAFGGLSVRNSGTEWTTLLQNQSYLEYLIPADYYALIGAGGLHLLSLTISLWLGLMFRRIANMPPDMNPLEDHLTSRAMHKRNKSSVATTYTSLSDTSVKRLSTPLEDRRRSGDPYEDLGRPPTIPFMHTRQNSRESIVSRTSSGDLPDRQYQVRHSNSPRNSAGSAAELKHMSAPPPPRSSHRGSYTEIPLHETGSPRPSSVVLPPSGASTPGRQAKFTEAWYASESLIQRTQQRQRAMNVADKARNIAGRTDNPRTYEAVSQRYDFDSDSDQENATSRRNGGLGKNGLYDEVSEMEDDDDGISTVLGSALRAPSAKAGHPNPLRSNPSFPILPQSPASTSTGSGPRSKTPYRPRNSEALSEISLNSRSVSGSGDIADAKPSSDSRLAPGKPGGAYNGRLRNSSIQPESEFYSKPYGELKAATPPLIQTVGTGRQVSSGNDYDLGASGRNSMYGRRNVSGKIAEEGRAGARHSRYSMLNDD